MSEQQYEIVFYGKLVAGFTEQETKQHVAQLFKTSVDQVERMFTGKRVVIRNKLDQETAKKYIVAMSKRGAECQVEAMGAPGVSVDLSAPAAQVSPAPAPAPAPAPETASTPPVASGHKTSAEEVASKTGLKLAGDKVDDILSSTHFEIAEVGARISEVHDEVIAEYHELDSVTLAPVGSDMADKKEELPPVIPDTSHLTLE